MQASINFLQLHYLDVKFFHVFFVAMWSFSTIVAYMYYVVPAFKAHALNPDDAQLIAQRNWAMERFDKGVILEHIAFPIVLFTGVLLFLAADQSLEFYMLSLRKPRGVSPVQLVNARIKAAGSEKFSW